MRILNDLELWALRTSMPGSSESVEWDDDDPRYEEFMRVHEQLVALGLLTCDVTRAYDHERHGEWQTFTFRTTPRGAHELRLQLMVRQAA